MAAAVLAITSSSFFHTTLFPALLALRGIPRGRVSRAGLNFFEP